MDLISRFPHLFYRAPVPVPEPAPAAPKPSPNTTPSLPQVVAACLEYHGMVGNTQAVARDVLSCIAEFTAMSTPAPTSTTSTSTT